jgi:hypothetical protein
MDATLASLESKAKKMRAESRGKADRFADLKVFLLMQGAGMQDANPTVLVFDDDPEFRDSVVRLLQTLGCAQ